MCTILYHNAEKPLAFIRCGLIPRGFLLRICFRSTILVLKDKVRVFLTRNEQCNINLVTLPQERLGFGCVQCYTCSCTYKLTDYITSLVSQT